MTVTTTLPPNIAAAVAEADRLVPVWLIPGRDTWRKDADGVPVIDDMMVALGRLRGQRIPRVDLATRYDGGWTVSERHSREEHEAAMLPEAILLLLAGELRRTCAGCLQYDGHDSTCSLIAAEASA